MYIGLQEIYLLVDPKGYPFVPITEPSKEYLAAEIGSFRNLHECNRYTLDLAQKKFHSKRISFYSQENIVELNYLLALIDKGIRSSIALLRENALKQSADNFSEEIKDIETDLVIFFDILMKLPDIAQDVRINYCLFVKGFDNFSQIFLYSDNNELLLNSCLFYLIIFKYTKQTEVNLYEQMPQEDQELMCSIFCAYLSFQKHSGRMEIRDLLQYLPGFEIQPKQITNGKKPVLADVTIDIEIEFAASQSNQEGNAATLSISEPNADKKYNLQKTSCFLAANQILKGHLSEEQFKNQKRPQYSIGFLKLLFELRIAKTAASNNSDAYLIGAQQLVFLHLNLFGAKKPLFNYSQFLNISPIVPLEAYFDQIMVQKYCLKSLLGLLDQDGPKQPESQPNGSYNNKLKLCLALQQEKESPPLFLLLRTLSLCGPLIASLSQYKLESQFAVEFHLTEEEGLSDLWILFFENILQLTFEDERALNFGDCLSLFKVFNSFLAEVEYLGIQISLPIIENTLDQAAIQKMGQIQEKLKKVFEKLSIIRKTFLKVKMQEFISNPQKYLLNILLLCELPIVDSDLGFKVFEKFLNLMLKEHILLTNELGEQAIQRIFLNLISFVFNDKNQSSTVYIQALINRQLFERIKGQINLGNPYGHLLINQILYHILEADIQFTTRYLLYQIDEKPQEIWEIIAETFEVLSSRNQIVFLKGFRLIKRFLEELIDVHKRSEEIIRATKVCRIYSELCIKNTLIWGQRSGIQEHTEVIQLAYPELQRELKSQMAKLMDMIKSEDEMVVKYLDLNHKAYKAAMKQQRLQKQAADPFYNVDNYDKNTTELSDAAQQPFSLAYHSMFTLLEFKYKVLCSNGFYYINCICSTLNKGILQSEFEEIFLYCLNCCSPLAPQIQKKPKKDSGGGNTSQSPSNQALLRHQATELFSRLRKFSDEDAQPVLMVITEVCKDYFDNLPLLLKSLFLYSKKSLPKHRNPPFLMLRFWKDSRQSFLKLLQDGRFTGELYETLKQLRQCELVLFLFKKAVLHLYGVGHYINSNEFYDNYAFICQKAIEAQEILSVSFLGEMCDHVNFKLSKGISYANTHQSKPLSLNNQLKKYEKSTFLADAKSTSSFDNYVLRNSRLPKMIFKITLLATKLKRVDLSLIPDHAQTEHRFSQRYSRMVREIVFQIVKYNTQNIIYLSKKRELSPLQTLVFYLFYTEKIRSSTYCVPNCYGGHFFPILNSETFSAGSMILSSILQALKAQDITIDYSSNDLKSLEKSMLRDLFFSFLKHHVHFNDLILRDLTVPPRIYSKTYLMSTDILPHYKKEIEQSDGYFKIATEYTSYMKHVFQSMPSFARFNEQIPEKLANSFLEKVKEFQAYQHFTDEDKEKLKICFEDLSLRILNLYLHSTYENQVRTRSSNIYKVIFAYFNLEASTAEEIIVKKKILSIFFLKQLELHLKSFIPSWTVETHGGFVLKKKLFEKYKQEYVQSDLEHKLLLFKPNSMDPILNACTLAMIMNLLCRLIQDSSEMDPNLDSGMKLVFGQSWVSCKQFLRYLALMMEKTQFRKIGMDESNTLDFDPIRYSMVITEHLLSYSQEILLKIEKASPSEREILTGAVENSELFTRENWKELFEVSMDIVKNYLLMETVQIEKYSNYSIQGLRSQPLRKFLGVIAMSLYQDPSEDKVLRVIRELFPILQKTPINQKNFAGWTNAFLNLLRQLADSAFIFGSDKSFKKSCLKLHILNLFYDKFSCSVIEKQMISNLKNQPGSVFASEPELFMEILNEEFELDLENTSNNPTNQEQKNHVQNKKNTQQMLKLKNLDIFNNPESFLYEQFPPLCAEMLNFLVDAFSNSLTSMLTQVYQQKSNIFFSTFSHEISLKIIIQLCGKYPLATQYILNKELDAYNLLVQSIQIPRLYESIHSHIQIKGNRISFLELLFIMAPYSFSVARQFFKFLSNSINFSFKKVSRENGETLIVGSNYELREYLLKIHEDKITEIVQENKSYLATDHAFIELREILISYYQLQLGGEYSHQQSVSIDEEIYLKNNKKNDSKLPEFYLEKKEEQLKKCHSIFSKVLLLCSKSQDKLNLLTALNFYSMFKHIYKEILQIQYDHFTCKHYIKGDHLLLSIKKLSNKQIVSFMTERDFSFMAKLKEKLKSKYENRQTLYEISIPLDMFQIGQVVKESKEKAQDLKQQPRKQLFFDVNIAQKDKNMNTFLRKNTKESFSRFCVPRGAWAVCVYGKEIRTNGQEYLKDQVNSNKLQGELPSNLFGEWKEWQMNYLCEDEDSEQFYTGCIFDSEESDKWPQKFNNLKPQSIYQQILVQFVENSMTVCFESLSSPQSQGSSQKRGYNYNHDSSIISRQSPFRATTEGSQKNGSFFSEEKRMPEKRSPNLQLLKEGSPEWINMLGQEMPSQSHNPFDFQYDHPYTGEREENSIIFQESNKRPRGEDDEEEEEEEKQHTEENKVLMGNREADGEYEEGKENSEIEMSCSESSGGARLAYETLFNESPGRQYRSEEIHVEDEQKEDFIDEIQEDDQIQEYEIDSDHNLDEESYQIMMEFDWTQLDFPKNALNLYEIDKQLFRLASDEERIEILMVAQEAYKVKKEREQAEIISRIPQRSSTLPSSDQLFDFESYGFSASSLNEFGIDRAYFFSLPDDLKVEMLSLMRSEVEGSNETNSNNSQGRNMAVEATGGSRGPRYQEENDEDEIPEQGMKKMKKNRRELSEKEREYEKIKLMLLREKMATKKVGQSIGSQTRITYRQSEVKQIVSYLSRLDPSQQEHILKLADSSLIDKLPKEMKQRALNLRKAFNLPPESNNITNQNSSNNNSRSMHNYTLHDLTSRRNTVRRAHDLLYLPSIDDLRYPDSPESSSEEDNPNINKSDNQYERMNEHPLCIRSSDLEEKNWQGFNNSSGCIQSEEMKESTIQEDFCQYGLDSPQFFMSLLEVDEGVLIASLLSAIFVPIKIPASDNYTSYSDSIFRTLKVFSLNPVNGYKIADALTFFFSLTEKNMLFILKSEKMKLFLHPNYSGEGFTMNITEIHSRVCSLIRRLIQADICVPLYVQGVINTNKPLQLSTPSLIFENASPNIQKNKQESPKNPQQLSSISQPQFSSPSTFNFPGQPQDRIDLQSMKFIEDMRKLIKEQSSQDKISSVFLDFKNNCSVFELGIKLLGEQILEKTVTDEEGLLVVDFIISKSEFVAPLIFENKGKGTLNKNDSIRNRNHSHDTGETSKELNKMSADSAFCSLLSQAKKPAPASFNASNLSENEFTNFDHFKANKKKAHLRHLKSSEFDVKSQRKSINLPNQLRKEWKSYSAVLNSREGSPDHKNFSNKKKTKNTIYSHYVTENEKYVLGEQIVNENFKKTLCEIIFKSNRRLKSCKNLRNIVISLITFRSSNFMVIMCGVLEHFGRELSESVTKIQHATEAFRQNVLLKMHFSKNIPLTEQITDQKQLANLIKQFEAETIYRHGTSSQSNQDFRLVFHSLRHFVKDMKEIFEENILEEAISLYIYAERREREKEINKLFRRIQDILSVATPEVSMLDISSAADFTSRHQLELVRMQDRTQNQGYSQSQVNLSKVPSSVFKRMETKEGLESVGQLQYDEESVMTKHKKDQVVNNLKNEISEKQRDMQKWILEQRQGISNRFAVFMKKKIYAIRSLNITFRESVEYLFTLQEIIGSDFNSLNPLTLDLYDHWKYSLKSLILLHSLINPYFIKQPSEEIPNNSKETSIKEKQSKLEEEDQQSDSFSDSGSQNSNSSDGEDLLTRPRHKLDSIDFIEEMEDDDQSFPRLSRLFTQEESDLTKLPTSLLFRSKSASNEPQFDMDSTFSLLYLPKILQPIEQLVAENADRLDNYHHFVRHSNSKDKLPLKLKLNFLRSLSKMNALEKQKELLSENSSPMSSIKCVIERDKTWFSTLEFFSRFTPTEIAVKQIKIQFKGEDGIDYGGLTREWLALLSKEVFNPDYGLFQLSANKRSIQPSPLSMIVPDHLNHFLFLGRLVGKCLVENWHFDINFCRSFLKHMLNKNLYVHDLEDIDPELSKSLVWMLDNDVEDLMYDFSYIETILGQQKTIELVENGSNIPVTEINKKEYVKKFCSAKMIQNIENQAKAFIKGLEQIVPREALELFNEQELGLHLTGMPTVDIDDMKKNTLYQAYSENHRVVNWFWEILREENELYRANFLFFLTGSFKVPYGGFKNFPLKIDRGVSPESLPVAHTCFNQIDLPEYQSKEKLQQKLLIAISEGSQGFHIG